MLMAVRLLGLDKLRSKVEINHIAVTVFDVFLASPATHAQITTELAYRDAGIFDFFSHGQSPWSYVIESGDFPGLHRECIDTLAQNRSGHCGLKGSGVRPVPVQVFLEALQVPLKTS